MCWVGGVTASLKQAQSGYQKMKFDYFEPGSINQAIELLEKYGHQAKVIAAGTDLVVQMKEKVAKPKYLIDLRKIDSLHRIEKKRDGGLWIGPLATMSDLEKHPEVKRLYPIVSQAAGQVSIAIRNMATVGGNICTASPSADSPPALIASGASLRITGPSGEREMTLEEFFLEPGKVALEKAEIVTSIELPAPLAPTGAVYLKYALKGSNDLAIVGVAASISLSKDKRVCKRARIVLGAVAPTPIRALTAEAKLEGEDIGEREIRESAKSASQEATPITDLRATAEYRKEMTYLFTQQAITESLNQLRED